MSRDKKAKQGRMLAPSDQVAIKQQPSYPTRYKGMLAPTSEVDIKQQPTYPTRY